MDLNTLMKTLSLLGLLAIAAFLCYGWLRGLSRDMQLNKRRHH